MTGIAVELIISWLLLWLVEKKHLSALGLRPTHSRMVNLGIGLLMAALSCTTYHILATAFSGNGWLLNKQTSLESLSAGSWWTLKSVLFEELIFRGALLYIAIKKLGINRACFLSAACFGFYHWFSYEVIGNPVQMIFIFFMTGIFGLMLAFAFAKTGSLFLPAGLHFGWNVIHIVVFSGGPLGQQLLVKANDTPLQGFPSLLLYLFQVVTLPLLTWLYLRQISKRQIPTP